ncbi:MAG: repeat protein, partial [Cellvibrio sp.]|nr:repeat protein [Cellvibrio sp.]
MKRYTHKFPCLILTLCFSKNGFMDMKKINITWILWLLLAVGADAQTVFGPSEETAKINSMQLLNMLTTNDFGESYDPATGTLSLAYTDVSLPGNSPLRVEVRRKFSSNLGTGRFTGLWELGDWSLDLPYVRGEFLKAEGQYISLSGNKGWSFGKECEGDVSTVNGRAWDSSGSSWPLSPSHYWSGKFLHIPQQVSENLIWGRGSYAGKQVTKANYIVTSCFSRTDGKGQGIVVTAPDGTRYTFDYVVEKPNGMPMPVGNGGYMRWLMATKVEDKFGNTVTYNYLDGLLRSIAASDGRSITLNYSGKYLANVVVNGRTWTYTYDTSVAARTRLDKVTLPDGKSWTFGKLSRDIYAASVQRWKTLSQTPGHCAPIPQSNVEHIIETPAKLKISYSFAITYHGIYDTKAYPYGDDPKWQAFNNANCSAYWSLVKKTVMGPGIPLQTWNYAYSQNGGNYYEGTGDGNKYGYGQLQNKRLTESWSQPVALTFPYSKPDSVRDASSVKTTIVTGPSAKDIYYVDRTFDSPTQNMVLAVDTADISTGKLLKREESYFQKGDIFADYCSLSFMPALYPNMPYKCAIYSNLENSNYRINLNQKKTILYDAAGSATSYATAYSGYDFYGFPSLASETNSYSARERYTQINYLHDVTGWVLGLPKSTLVSQYSSGPFTEVNRIDYVSKSVSGLYSDVQVADKVYSYGALNKYFKEYHDDGNIKRMEYANTSRWIDYSNYKRGEPQTIMTPSSESSTPQYTYKEVDDNGWLKKVTDPKGYIFVYEYSPIGLIANISYESVAWEPWVPTKIEYLSATGVEGISGVVSGMLNQKITKGNYSKNLYYDALNRPLVAVEEDVADAQTKRFFARKYDINNNITFDAYPSSASGSNVGIAYVYDALGRNTTVTQDSSNGKVSSTSVYLSGNKVLSKDFKSNTTVNEFLAYGQPEYEKTLSIDSPESVLTNITYNIFGSATSISQGGITQYNVYDAQQQLCKQIRPDIGNKAFHYNITGDVDWFAHSDSISSVTTECDFEVDAVDKVSHVYENFGAIKTISYGDGTSSKTFTYDKNGNISKLVHSGYTLSYSYDFFNRLRNEKIEYRRNLITIDNSIFYSFNSMGHLAQIGYPTTLTLKFYPNALGQATVVKDGFRNGEISGGVDTYAVYAKNIKYHPSGEVDSFVYGNNLTYKMAQNSQL